MAQNPYTLAFGTEPTELIPRTVANSEVIDAFSAKQPPSRSIWSREYEGAARRFS